MAIEHLKARLTEQVAAYLNGNGWLFEHDAERSFFKLGFSLKNRLENTQACIICRDKGLTFWFRLPNKPAGAYVHETMEFLARANYGLVNGAFEMDPDDNDILYRIFLPCDSVPSTALIDDQVDTGLAMLELYGDELLAVLSGAKKAAEAVKDAEKHPDDREPPRPGAGPQRPSRHLL